ncbi:MAG: SPFH domain-containing protein, partial [Streptococcus sp.]|nr:SPFH domain-containing protein [Streptococcus sp.]
ILLEDLSYDQESLDIVRKLDSELVAMKYNTIEIEERRARNEALIAAAANEGNGNGMNMFMGMNLGQTLGGQLSQQVQNQAPTQNTGQTASKNFYIEVDGKYVLVTKDEDGNIVPVN